ncbi:MAG TPA: histidine phosphatase family protein [Methylophaga sp.]|nr:histidine phosphatase family protein [Methylophaga sp.]
MLRHVLLCLTFLALPVQATDLSLLTKPGYALLLRHALAPGVGDPTGFQLDDCATQRNLSMQGRQQARHIGHQLRAAGIKKAVVYSSHWCRCLETAELLGFGEPQPLSAINSFFQSKDPNAKTKATKAFQQHLISGRHQTARIYISHQVNLSALLGGFAASGSGYLIYITEQGDIEIINEFSID